MHCGSDMVIELNTVHNAQSTPQRSPDSSLSSTPQGTPKVTPQGSPKATPQGSPKVTDDRLLPYNMRSACDLIKVTSA